jgi:hypothetical protein
MKPERLRKGGGEPARGRRSYFLEMLRTPITRILVGGVAVIVVAAAIDAVRSSESRTPPTEGSPVRDADREGQAEEVAQSTVAKTETGPLERCTAGQLALRVERLGGTLVLALAHVWGSPCRTARIPIEVALFGRKGNLVNPDEAGVGVSPQAFGSTTLSSGVEVIAELHVSYLCGAPRPRRLLADARPYVARKWLPRGYVACLDDLGP